MKVIKVYIKKRANNRECVDEGQSESDLEVQVIKEQQEKTPTISQAPLGPELVEAVSAIKGLFTIDSMVKIIGEVFITIFITQQYKKTKEVLLNLIRSNNRQKGNVFGTKVIIDKVLDDKSIQTYHFICDDIPTNDLEHALCLIDNRIKNINTLIDKDSLNKIKNLAFRYDQTEWKIVSLEKNDSET